MVKGLEVFAERFAGFEDCYVLIGGTAAYLVQQEAALEPRATQDLDIVLCVESLTAEFGQQMWDFIEEGGYEVRQVGAQPRKFYRFDKPSDDRFPKMLEFFAREPDHISLAEPGDLTPIPVDEAVVSLSAILLDEDYYAVIRDNTRPSMNGVPIITEYALIPLKARAWVDLSARRERGEGVDSRDVKKHRNDIFRLYSLLLPGEGTVLPEAVQQDMRAFVEAHRGQLEPGYLKDMGITDESGDEVLDQLAEVFGVLA